MTYSTIFKEFVNLGLQSESFIGSGNPNAQILIVGKESALESKDDLWYKNNAKDWNEHIKNGTCEELDYDVRERYALIENWGRNTWSKYQKLHDEIFQKVPIPFRVNFTKNIFTTEINDNPSRITRNASKLGMSERKQFFKNSEFIQSFPVVILACSNYFKNNVKHREINGTFRVTFDDHNMNKYKCSRYNTFYLHHSSDKRKLVIHTRQLSSNVKNEMLNEIGIVVRDHLMKVDKF